MAKTRSMTRNENHADDASLSSRKKRFKTFGKGDVAPWSDLNYDVLLLVMMQLGVVDFFAFGRVCKSWRSAALFKRKTFMASKPPMSICISREANEDEWFYREDFDGKGFRTIFTHAARRLCVGSTCGYLALFKKENHEFWLVNPITRHELHFPFFPFNAGALRDRIRTILVFSSSTYGWVFVVLCRFTKIISFHILGKQRWVQVPSTLPISDLHFFKGKIYTIHADCSLGELRLTRNWKRRWTLLKTKNLPNPYSFKPELVSSDENLYLIYGYRKVMELDFCEMKWVLPEKTAGDYAVFLSDLKSCATIKLESWAGPWTPGMYNYKAMWYFPHDYLKVNLLD